MFAGEAVRLMYVPHSSLDAMRHSKGTRLVDVASFTKLRSQPSLPVALYRTLHPAVVFCETMLFE